MKKITLSGILGFLSFFLLSGTFILSAQGTGSRENPYSIEEALDKQGENGVWIKGYIVGTPNGSSVFSPIIFTGPFSNNLYIVLADDKEEQTESKMIPVNLPYGDIRNKLSLNQNAGNLKEEVLIKGNIATGVVQKVGLKDLTAYDFTNPLMSDDATLSSVMVNGVSVNDFDPAKTSYIFYLENTNIPVVKVTTSNGSATSSVSYPENIPGEASILVTAGNQITKKTYTVYLTNEPAGEGTKENPYSVKEAQIFQGTTSIYYWVKGYIVGAPSGSNISSTQFETPFSGDGNMVIATSSSERDLNKLLAVNLPSGILRTRLNLKTNPVNLGQEVLLKGYLKTNLSVAGLTNTNEFEFTDPDFSDDATLSSITVNGTAISGFDAAKMNYISYLANTNVPTVAATVNHQGAKTTVTLPESIPGEASILVTAGNNVTQKTYTVYLTNEEAGDGTKEKPYSVKEAQVFQSTANTYYWVKGHIVGAPSGSTISTVQFEAPFSGEGNLVLASSITEQNLNELLPVNLPSGALRTRLNLKTNPVNLGQQILIRGYLKTNMNVPGVMSMTEFEFIDPNFSDDATLSNITVNGTAVSGFDAAKLNYIFYLDHTTLPTIAGTVNHQGAKTTVTLPESIPGEASILVTAGNNVTQKTYTVYLTNEEAGDGTKEKPYSIKEAQIFQGLNGVWVKGYIVGEPTGSSVLDPVRFTAPFSSSFYIVLGQTSIEQTISKLLPVNVPTAFRSQLLLKDKIENLGKEVLLKVNLTTVLQTVGANNISDCEFLVTPLSDDATLSDIKVNATPLADFESSKTTYIHTLAPGTTVVPTVSVTTTHAGAATQIEDASGLPGATVITVTAEDGVTTKRYTVNFTVTIPGDGTKENPYSIAEAIVNQGSSFNGVWVKGYIVGVPTSGSPINVDFEAPFESQMNMALADAADERIISNLLAVNLTTTLRPKLNLQNNPENHLEEILIKGNLTANLGVPGMNTLTDYEFTNPMMSEDATLAAIFIDGTSLEEFSTDKEGYIYYLPSGTTQAPEVTVTTSKEQATKQIIPASSIPGETVITVKSPNAKVTKTYSVYFTADEKGDGTKEKPYSVKEAQVYQGKTDVWVKGFIVGAPQGSSTMLPVQFTAPFTSKTYFVLASVETEQNTGNLIPVSLSYGANLRDKLNLNQNPSNLGEEILLKGTLARTLQTTGIYSITEFEFTNPAMSEDATLSAILVNGTPITEFDPAKTQYIHYLENTTIPTVEGTPTNSLATTNVTPPEAIPGEAVIVVTAPNGIATKSYTVYLTADHAGEGTKENPYSIKEISTIKPTTEVWVKGYIVGVARNSITNMYYEPPFEGVKLDFVIATDPQERETAKLFPVQLVENRFKTELNLPDNPTHLGKEISVCGIFSSNYMNSKAGLVNISDYEFAIAPPSNDATLSEIKAGENSIEGFDPLKTSYIVYVPAGTTQIPQITSTTNHEGAEAVVVNATSIPGDAIINVTAEDGKATKAYKVYITDRPQGDGTKTKPYSIREALLCQATTGVWVEGFIVGVADNSINLPIFEMPFGDKKTNILLATDPADREITILFPVQLLDNAFRTALNLPDHPEHIERGALLFGDITTSFMGSATGMRNLSDYELEPLPSDDATLSGIKVDETPLTGFLATKTQYYVSLPASTAGIPVVTAEATHEKATISVVNITEIPADAVITVTAENGDTKEYKVYFTKEAAEGEKGSSTNPFTIAEALATQYPTGVLTQYWIKGHIVGSIDGVGVEDARFIPPFSSLSNILLANSKEENNIANCIVAELPAGEIRSKLNLNQNEGNKGKEAALYGKLTSHFGTAGIRGITNYKLETGSGIGNPEGNSQLIYSTKGKINIVLNTSDKELVEIYDLLGNKLMSQTITRGLNSIELKSQKMVIVKINNIVSKVIIL